MKYKYTFLCPSYKSDFLEESLRSMLGQTLHNFKILLSDDCSPAPIYEVYKKIKEGLPPPTAGIVYHTEGITSTLEAQSSLIIGTYY